MTATRSILKLLLLCFFGTWMTTIASSFAGTRNKPSHVGVQLERMTAITQMWLIRGHAAIFKDYKYVW